jgi:hypothetical protein
VTVPSSPTATDGVNAWEFWTLPGGVALTWIAADQVRPPSIDRLYAMLSHRNAPVWKKLKRASIQTAWSVPLAGSTATSGMKSPPRIGQAPACAGSGQATA